MKLPRLGVTLAVFAFVALAPFTHADGLPPDAHTLKLGDQAPAFTLPGIDGRNYTLSDFASAPVLMVVFLSNHCPFSHAAETRLIPLAKEFAPKGLAVVAINPNSPEGLRLDEMGWSKYDDSFEDMKLYAKEQGFPFPYLYDGDTQKVAKAYGCLATPHVFLFDRERRLRYVGRVDDSRFPDPATVKSADTRNAVVQLLAGEPVKVPTTPVMGCSTKWNEKKGEVQQAVQRWNNQPVTLEKIDPAGVAKLAKNESKRFRLINVWATWCAPCVAEFPDLVALSRRMDMRDFEFVTLSVDDPKLEPRVKAFLEKHHVAPVDRLSRQLKGEGRTTLNFLYSEASTDALVQALDPSWEGPLPHTLLIAPGGKVLYRHTGPVDPIELRAKVVEAMSPYYREGVDQ
jgi:peroxiredoxin